MQHKPFPSASLPRAGLLRAPLLSFVLTSLYKTSAQIPCGWGLAKAMWPLACQVPGAEHGKHFVSRGWFGKERTEQKKLPGLIWHGMSPGIWGKVPLDTQGLQMVQPIHCTWLSVDKTRTKQAKNPNHHILWRQSWKAAWK